MYGQNFTFAYLTEKKSTRNIFSCFLFGRYFLNSLIAYICYIFYISEIKNDEQKNYIFLNFPICKHFTSNKNPCIVTKNCCNKYFMSISKKKCFLFFQEQ